MKIINYYLIIINIIGKIFNFKEGDLFELEDRKIEGENIKVDM